MTGVVAAALVAHVPTLGRPEITPDFQQTLVEGERRLGEALRRSLKPDLWVIASTHWVSTFNWFATCQAMHEGVCVADEAPDLIPGISYRYRGDSEFAQALVEEWKMSEVPAARNDSPHYGWDYGTWVPLSHLDPGAEVAVVGVPVVLMADHAECLRATPWQSGSVGGQCSSPAAP
jgi:3,4-dihydroxyphenylacetate 2,3-dioxygenase